MQHVFVEAQIGNQLLQPRVLFHEVEVGDRTLDLDAPVGAEISVVGDSRSSGADVHDVAGTGEINGQMPHTIRT